MAAVMTKKSESKLKKLHSPASVQFAFVLLVVLTMILFTSASFYQSMIENYTAIELQKAITELKGFDLSDDEAIRQIHDMELKNSMIVEIYEKDNPQKALYRQSSSYMFDNGNTRSSVTSPLISLDYEAFSKSEGIKEFSPYCKAGVFTNRQTGYAFYVMTCTYPDNPYLYVAGVSTFIINAQADIVSLSVIIILLITFVVVSLIAYLFFTRITKPMRNIRNVTKAMAETNDVTLRIPERKARITTDTDETVKSVNYLYENLIITQEALKEKSEFLTAQLEERDIEQKSREEFIASTSHELKTPISIIQGYAEGAKFLKNDPEALEEYCDTIIDECVRMNDLVVNMMSLSGLQHTNKVKFDKFSIRDFIEERIKVHEKTFEKNGITAESLIKDDIYGRGEVEKLQFVVNNLISNAVAYMGGERILKIRYEDIGPVYRIYVFNSGNPIPDTELEKLWNAFYRNDPARNRNEGHFGLGLSIVKSVQDAHSQSCGVDNAEGGVEFWFDILK